MIKNAGNLIAIYDGKDNGIVRGSGTLHTINIARMRGLKMRIINPVTLSLTDEIAK